MTGEKKMKKNSFDLFEGIELTKEEKNHFEVQKKVSDIIVRIIEKRVELNMSQRDLAELTGIKQPMIARIENMDTTPRIDTLIKIASSLGLNLSFDDVKVYVTFKVEVNYNNSTNNYSIVNMGDRTCLQPLFS